MNREVYQHFESTVVRSTDKAILVEIAGVEHWIPKSVLSHSERQMNDWEPGDSVELKVVEWFANKEDL